MNHHATTSSSGADVSGESTTWVDFPTPPDDEIDELLSSFGYQVNSTEIFNVAQKIEHLECILQNDNFSQITSNSVHYNPSDLSSWLDYIISDITNIVSPPITHPPPAKKPKASSPATSGSPAVILIEAQENGVRLVHTLLACAEAVDRADIRLAETLVKRAGILAASQPGAMKKVAAYFAEALARRIYGFNPDLLQHSPVNDHVLHMHFYEIAPYLKFAHFTANQAILEAVGNSEKVHVIDFSMKEGMQWPALIQALAVRPGGPPSFRLTAVGPPSGDNTDYLQEVGWRLARLAETINVEFEYRGFIAESLADIEPGMFGLREGEVVAVNSIFELHRLLGRPGAVEKVLFAIKEMKPEIVTVVEQEANHNGARFLERFTESLHYYSTLFDSLESSDGGVGAESNRDKIMSEVYLGKQICNVIACEGSDRVERHEMLSQWKTRFDLCGFESVHLGSNAYKQASMLLDLFAGGDGYRVEENNGCLMLGWHTRSLIATSAWKVRSSQLGK